MSLTPPHQAPHPDESRWFAEEVHTHETLLKAYLRASFPSVRDVDDIVQESYLRVWKAKLSRPILSAKSFLFQVARHLAIDALRRDRSSPAKIVGDLDALSVMDTRPGPAEALGYREKVCLVAAALSSLPKGCRNVIVLCKFERIQQKEVASRLGISERTVESQVARGMKLCEKYLRRNGVRSFSGDVG